MPAPPTDFDLLDRFAHSRDAPAFNELARRYLNLIHSSATRRVGDRALAEDVTQAVLMILAKRPHAARKSGSLVAWLLTTVRYAAANAIKIEQRRRHNERRAALSSATGVCSANPSDALLWQELGAQLDDAVLKLPALDRRAVLLRYFEERPIRDVAQALNVTEAAAKQRLSRSLTKLRDRLTRQGVSFPAQTGAASLTTLLTTHAVIAAPPGLLSPTAAAAIATGATAASSTSLTIAKGVITMMTWTKIKAAAAVLAVASVLGAGAAVTINHAKAQPANAPNTELHDRATARVQAAQKVVEVLNTEVRSGLAPSAELGAAQRRLGEARIDAAEDPAGRIRAAEEYVNECRVALEIVKKRMEQGVAKVADVRQGEYYLADAQYTLAKLK